MFSEKKNGGHRLNFYATGLLKIYVFHDFYHYVYGKIGTFLDKKCHRKKLTSDNFMIFKYNEENIVLVNLIT